MKGFGIEIKNDLLDPKHIEKMGIAVWLYMWLIDKVTSITEEGIGKVLGGKPIKFEEVHAELGISVRTYRRWVADLETHGYITTITAPYGLIFQVKKAHKKFGKSYAKSGTPIKKRSAKSGTVDMPQTAHLAAKSGTPNKTSTVDTTVDKEAAATAAAMVKPFSPEETKQKWFEGEKEDFQLLAWFFEQKGAWKKFDAKEKVEHAVQRHIRAARRIVRAGWSQKECDSALKQIKSNPKLDSEWTLETLEKYLTK